MGRDDIATAYIGQLQQAQMDLERTGAQAEHAAACVEAGAKGARQLRPEYEEAHGRGDAAYQCRQAGQTSGTACPDDGRPSIIGDDASTFNEMREKIDRRVAAAEAKLQLGSLRSTLRCRTSSAKLWTSSYRTSCSNTNSRWACSVRDRALPAENRSRRVQAPQAMRTRSTSDPERNERNEPVELGEPLDKLGGAHIEHLVRYHMAD